MRRLWWGGLAVGLTLLALGFGGRWHGAGDALAVVRTWLVAAGLVWAGLGATLGVVRGVLAGLGAALLAVGLSVAMPRLPDGPRGAGPVIYQKNLSFRTDDLGPMADDIAASGAQVALLQEVSEAGAAMRQLLSPALPYWHRCQTETVGGEAVATAWAPLPDAPICGPGLAALRVTGPQGPVWLVSLHLRWPWPMGQADQVARMLPLLAALDGPVIVGGDFNMVPWSYAVRSIARATRTARSGTLRNSFAVRGIVPVPIDHILLPADWTGTSGLRPLAGSDHRGLTLTLTLP